MDILIRNALAYDLKDILEIERLSFTYPWTENMIRSEIENPRSISIVLEYKDSVKGYYFMRVFEDTAELLDLAVHPDFRNRGFASLLMSHLSSTCQNKAVKNITLEVRLNSPAVNFYKKHGFCGYAVRKNYYTNPTEDALLMIKTI